MVKKFFIGLLIGAFITSGVWFGLKPVLSLAATDTYVACKADWIGEIDVTFLNKVKADVMAAKNDHCKILTAHLLSPGGSVIFMFEVVKIIRDVEKDGVIVEIHASSLTASAATFILGAGSKNHRFVGRHTISLVHAPQCETCKPEEFNLITIEMARLYSEITGRSVDETFGWMTSGREMLGDAYLLVNLGLADWIEEN